jgi:8-oxo-dGTP diphosphatase
VTHFALALADAANSPRKTSAWFDVSEPSRLNQTGRMIVDYALRRLRSKPEYSTIAFHLLPLNFNFTLTGLQAMYEDVLDSQVDKRNFRRRIHAGRHFKGTGESRRKGSQCCARLYQLRGAHDAETYLTPTRSTQPVRKLVKP